MYLFWCANGIFYRIGNEAVPLLWKWGGGERERGGGKGSEIWSDCTEGAVATATMHRCQKRKKKRLAYIFSASWSGHLDSPTACKLIHIFPLTNRKQVPSSHAREMSSLQQNYVHTRCVTSSRHQNAFALGTIFAHL